MLKYCLIIVVVIIGLVFALQEEKRYLRCDGTLESNDSIRQYELFLDITKRSSLIFWFDFDGHIITRPGLLTSGYNFKNYGDRLVLSSDDPDGEYILAKDTLILETRYGVYKAQCEAFIPALADW